MFLADENDPGCDLATEMCNEAGFVGNYYMIVNGSPGRKLNEYFRSEFNHGSIEDVYMLADDDDLQGLHRQFETIKIAEEKGGTPWVCGPREHDFVDVVSTEIRCARWTANGFEAASLVGTCVSFSGAVIRNVFAENKSPWGEDGKDRGFMQAAKNIGDGSVFECLDSEDAMPTCLQHGGNINPRPFPDVGSSTTCGSFSVRGVSGFNDRHRLAVGHVRSMMALRESPPNVKSIGVKMVISYDQASGVHVSSVSSVSLP